MKKGLILVLIFAFAVLGAEISGTCYNGTFPIPFPMGDVELELVPEGGGASAFAITGFDGSYVFAGVETGEYLLRPSSSTGDPSSYSISVEDASAILTGYDFNITEGTSGDATVSGSVIYDDGSPAEGINITVMSDGGFMPAMIMTDIDGKYLTTIAPGNITVTAMALPPYTAVPDMHEVVLGEDGVAMGLDFRLVGDGPMAYMIMVNGTKDGAPTEFTAYYRPTVGDTIWHSVASMGTGSATIEVSDSGDYAIRAEKPGHIASPIEQIVHVSMFPAMAAFEFTDTTSSSDYLITVRAMDGMMPIMDYNAQWRSISDASWTTIIPRIMGVCDIVPPGPGTYEVTGWYDGRSPVPEITTVVLTDLMPTDSVVLNFADTASTSPIELVILSVDADGLPYPGLDIDWTTALDSTISSITTDADGFASLEFEMLASVTLTPDPAYGFYTIPEEESVFLTPLTPSDTVVFEVHNGAPVDYYVNTSAVDTAGDFFSTYLIQYREAGDSSWESSFSTSDYHDVEFVYPGTYEFTCLVLGYDPDPEIITVELSEASPFDTIQFTMLEPEDTTTSDAYITIISEDSDGAPYANLNFFWTRALADDSETLSTGASGVIDVTIDDYDYYTITSLPPTDYFTIPGEANSTISPFSEIDTITFTVYEGESGMYRINVSALGDSGEVVYDHVIQHRILGDDGWTSTYADSTGFTDLVYDIPGNHEVTVWKFGFTTIPEIDTVELTESFPVDTIVFNLTDTTEESEYSLTVISMDPDEAPYTGLIIEWENTFTGETGEFETDLGIHTETFTESAYLNLTPIVPGGHWVSPENTSSFLSPLNEADTVIFTVGEGEPPATYTITIWATDSSDNPQFGTSMGIDEETAITGMGGYASIEVEGPGSYAVEAWVTEIPGYEFVVVPGEFTVLLSETHVADTTHVYVTSVDGIEESSIPEELGFKIYPNPFNGECFIDAPADAEISIFDISGNLIETLPKGCSIWRAENNVSGIYIVKIALDGEVHHKHALYVK